MMFKKRAKSLVSVLLALIMVLSIFPMTVLAAGDMDESALPSDTYLISKTDYQIAPGIEETQFLINNADGSNQNAGFAVTVELGGTASLIASYRNQDGNTYGLQSVRDQAAAAERAKARAAERAAQRAAKQAAEAAAKEAAAAPAAAPAEAAGAVPGNPHGSV